MDEEVQEGVEEVSDIWVPEPEEENEEVQEAQEEVTEQAAETQEDEAVEAKADEKVEEDVLPPLDWKPAIQPDLYTTEEQTWLERAQDDPDPKLRLQAQQFMMNKTVEYNNKAALVAQAQMASIPQPFLAVHGPVVAEYLNTYVKPERRGAPEALEEAQAWAVMQRAKQVGPAKAYREAANLLEGQQIVRVQTPPPVAKLTVPKTVIPAEQRIPVGGGTVVEKTAKVSNRGLDRLEKALGYSLD